MGILSWIIVGGIGGWIGSLIVKSGRGIIGNIIAGIVGGVLAGWVVGLFTGTNPMTEISLTTIIIAAIGAIVVSALFGMVMGRGKSTVAEASSSASQMTKDATAATKDAANTMSSSAQTMTKDAAQGMSNAASSATNTATNVGNTAASMGGNTMNAAGAAAGAAMGAMNMDQLSGMLSGLMGGSMKLDANNPLTGIVTPIADGITSKLGLPKEVGQMVVVFAMAKLTEMMQSKSKGTSTPEADQVLAKIGGGQGIDTGTLNSTGLSKELATKAGISEQQASQGLEYAMGALSAGMSGQKTYGGTDLPDMSMLTGMMK